MNWLVLPLRHYHCYYTAINHLMRSGSVMAGEEFLGNQTCLQACREQEVHAAVTRGPFDRDALDNVLRTTTLRNVSLGYYKRL